MELENSETIQPLKNGSILAFIYPLIKFFIKVNEVRKDKIIEYLQPVKIHISKKL